MDEKEWIAVQKQCLMMIHAELPLGGRGSRTEQPPPERQLARGRRTGPVHQGSDLLRDCLGVRDLRHPGEGHGPARPVFCDQVHRRLLRAEGLPEQCVRRR